MPGDAWTMQRAEGIEHDRQAAGNRGAEQSAPRSTPLTMVSGAVAGADLQSLAGSASGELGQPVVIAIPALGDPIVSPEDSLAGDALHELAARADEAVSGDDDRGVGDAVPIKIGEQTVGIVAVMPVPGARTHPDRRAWLEGVATAAAVTALIRETREGSPENSRPALLRALAAGPPADAGMLVSQAQRLGFDFSSGAVAVAARRADDESTRGEPHGPFLAGHPSALLGELSPGRVAGLVPSASVEAADRLVAELADRGLTGSRSSLRRDPADLHEALREAELMLELLVSAPGKEETYRLLVGVLLRDADEVELLRQQTISPLVEYDDRHDTDLLATLSAFLAHHGSTSETAEAMGLHRHTVGYRLARVHEVSGLSPYESDGRERLSLGLKAHQILEADRRLSPAL
jgi:hypothetical protein